MLISIGPCDPETLESGEVCAPEDEQKAFAETLQFKIWIRTNFLEYEDIDEPERAQLINGVNERVDSANLIRRELLFQRHWFSRQDGYEQLLSPETESRFLSFKGESVSLIPTGDYFEYQFALSENVTVSSRRIYSIMSFLGDVGGF